MGFSLPFFKKKKTSTTYFGLYVTDASLFGFLFDTTSGTPQVITTSTVSLSAGFDKILEDTDNIISEIELKSSKHLDKTIFFLHSWMIDESTYEIKEPYKGIIKKLSKDLELDPMGYIDVQEALHEYLQNNSILNTVSIEVNKTKLGICVYKGGKKVFGQYTARTDTVGDDILSALQGIPGGTVLPTKMLVFGDVDSAEVASELAGYEWDIKTFTQHPTIEVLKQTDMNTALAATFTEEVVSQSKVPAPTSAPPVVQDSEGLKDAPQEDFGFMVGKDVAQENPPVTPSISPTPVLTQEIVEDDDLGTSSQSGKSSFLSRFSFPRLSMKGNSKPILFGIIAAVILFLGLFLYEYFFHTMDVTVYLNSQKLDDEFDITLPITSDESSDLAVVKRSTVQEFEDQKKTTGTREDGEKATGEVVIHNHTLETRKFARGTELRKGDLVFLIDSEVTVASASGTTATSDTSVIGKASVKATAYQIGPEYNIGKGSELSVASLSDTFKAFAETAFTGGSKKEVKTVSKADREALAKNVSDKADEGSAEVLGTSISGDDIFLSELTTVEISDTEFSGEVGEEASSLSVKAQSEIDFYTVQKALLQKKIAELFSKDLSSGFVVDANTLDLSIEDVDTDDEEVTITVSSSGKALKEVSEEQILGASTFKFPQSLSDSLKTTFDVSNVSVEQSFSLSPWTPLFKKNITVTTVSE